MGKGTAIRISNGSHRFNAVECGVYNLSLRGTEKTLTLFKLIHSNLYVALHLKVPVMLYSLQRARAGDKS